MSNETTFIELAKEFQEIVNNIANFDTENEMLTFIKKEDIVHNSINEFLGPPEDKSEEKNIIDQYYSKQELTVWKDEFMDGLKGSLKRIYKIQTLGEKLDLQKNFCPGGFSTEGDIAANLKCHNRNLNLMLSNLIKKNDLEIVISNEALDMGERLGRDKEIDTKMLLIGNQKEYYSFSSSKGSSEERLGLAIKAGEDYGLGEIIFKGNMYYTIHLPSIDYAERNKASENFFKYQVLLSASNPELSPFSKLLTAMGVSGETFGGFAGDLNLYPTVQNNEKETVLRKDVQKTIDDFKLVLFTAKHKINKPGRSKIHDQWHKIKEEEEVDQFMNDSLVVVEKFDDQFSYKNFAKQNLNICVFCPETDEHPPISFNCKGEQKKYYPFTTTVKDKNKCIDVPLMITDHFVVRGKSVAIYSGADGDGMGNEVKKFLNIIPYSGDDYDKKKMRK